MKKDEKKNTEKKKEPVVKDFEYYFELTKGYFFFLFIILCWTIWSICVTNNTKQIVLTGTLTCAETNKTTGE